MFPTRFFALRFFTGRYWPKAGAAAPVSPTLADLDVVLRHEAPPGLRMSCDSAMTVVMRLDARRTVSLKD